MFNDFVDWWEEVMVDDPDDEESDLDKALRDDPMNFGDWD